MTEPLNTKKELMKLSKPKLIKRCKSEHLPTNGTKLDMTSRLIKNHQSKKIIITKKNCLKLTNHLSYKSYTPTPHSNDIDKFQLSPTKMYRSRKIRSLDLSRTKSKRTTTFAIGGNAFGEFGLNHTLTLTQLTNISKSKNISKIYNGFQYTIYSNNKAKKCWSSGYNSHGQCGLGAFDEWITSYKQINITQIKKICTNVGGNCTFWINYKNKIYANGRNDSYQLGIGHNNNINKPVLIKQLTNVINIVDIQSAHSFSVALSSMDEAIKITIRWWSHNTRTLEKDIMKLIVAFTGGNTVYCTNDDMFYGGNDCAQNKWHKLCFFDDKNIIKIRTGSEHIVLLDVTGNIWCGGNNAFGQLGVGHGDDVSIPTLINMNKFKVCVVDIRCGLYHNLAIDSSGRCYAWGLAKRGQCGLGDDVLDMECVETPEVIEYFVDKKLKIKQIDCGNYHSFCKTRHAKYYLFGSNQHNQCLTFDEKSKVTLPYCINNVVKQKTNKKIIKGVYLGCNNTKIIVY